MKIINRWQCWLVALWRSFLNPGYMVSGHRWCEIERTKEKSVLECEVCNKISTGFFNTDTSTPMDICRNRPATKEPKSTLREATLKIVRTVADLQAEPVADKIISLFKDTLLKEINQKEKEVSHAEWTAPVGIRHRGYNDALEDIINLIKKQ